MAKGSENEVEAKQNPSYPQGLGQVPHFEPRHVLDSMAGIFSDRQGFAQMTLRTVDGSEFVCFVDGVTAKAWSDKLLALAGHMIIATRGEQNLDLRPIHELGDDDDEEKPLPPAPPAAPQSFTEKEKEILADPANAETPQEAQAVVRKALENAADGATKDFLESFHDKPAEFFSEFVKEIVRQKLPTVDHAHPLVIEIAERAGLGSELRPRRAL